MGGVCWCCAGSCRPVWPVFLLLAAAPVMLHPSESPAATVGKMYPRGNHWAVGHLMGKKSIESLTELREADHPPKPSEPGRLSELERSRRSERVLEALLQPENHKQARRRSSADALLHLHHSWRGRDRGEHFTETSDLLLLALNLQDNNST